MTLDEHIRHLGGLVTNFHALEFLLRAFLQNLAGARPVGVPYGTDIYSFPVGSYLPESELTSYDSLGQLITKYNEEMKKRGLPLIDASLVDVRDAIAHGRVSSEIADDMRLLKFDKPANGRVQITFNEKLTESWFNSQKKRVYGTIQAVYEKVKP